MDIRTSRELSQMTADELIAEFESTDSEIEVIDGRIERVDQDMQELAAEINQQLVPYEERIIELNLEQDRIRSYRGTVAMAQYRKAQESHQKLEQLIIRVLNGEADISSLRS